MNNKTKKIIKWSAIGIAIVAVIIVVSVVLAIKAIDGTTQRYEDFVTALENGEPAKGAPVSLISKDAIVDSVCYWYENRDFDRAIMWYNKAEACGCDNDVNVLLRSELLAFQGKYEQGIQALEAHLDTTPKNNAEERCYCHKALGSIYRMKGDYKTAIAHYKRSVEINPYYVRPMVCMAEIYEELGETKKAIDEYNNALRLFKANNEDHQFDQEIEVFSKKVETLLKSV